ncbi:MAG: hypothetical protein JSW63_04910 [Ignavibacterium sp.]|nr:MAG: hypothetical protein JSW63_04910 [Ignavibacterium sp.]
MRNKKMFLVLLSAFCLGLLSQNLIAQQNNLARMYYVKVKSGHGAEFAAALKEHSAWRKQAGDPWTWIVYQVANGKHLGHYLIRSGGHTWADFDDYEEFLRKGGVEFNKTVGPHIKSVSNVITAVDTVNIDWPENWQDVNLISLITYDLKPGHGPAFWQAANKYHNAIQEHNRDAHYAFGWNVNGGSGPRVSLALPFMNWADMQGPDETMRDFMRRVMGEEEADKLFMEFNDTYTSTESMILRVRYDLSVMPDM